MTPTEATDLAHRIVDTNGNRPPATEWADVLGRLDAGRAGTAFVKLRNTADHFTIPTYLATYKRLKTTDASTHDPCKACDDTGHHIIEGPSAHRADLYDDHGCDHDGQRPCAQCCHCHHAEPCQRCNP